MPTDVDTLPLRDRPLLKWHPYGAGHYRTWTGDDSNINSFAGICLAIYPAQIAVYYVGRDRKQVYPRTPAELSDVTLAMRRAEAYAGKIMQAEFGALLRGER